MTGKAVPSLLRIAANNKVDFVKLSPFMKKYLKAAVASGEVVQTKSKGTSGSIRLANTQPEKVLHPFSISDGGSSGPKEKKQNSAKAKPDHPEKVL